MENQKKGMFYGVVEFVGINTGTPSAPTIRISTSGAILCKACTQR